MKNILIISKNGGLKEEFDSTGFFGEVRSLEFFSNNKLKGIDILIVDGSTIPYSQYLKNFSLFLNRVDSNYYIAGDLDTYSAVSKNLSSYGIIIIPPLLTDKKICQKICSLTVSDFEARNNSICFFGAGPGVGTTMLSQSVAFVLSNLIGKSINYLSLDGRYGTDYFDIDSGVGGLSDIKEKLINNILSVDEFKSSCIKINNLYILPGENDIAKVRHYHPEHIESLVELSSRSFDITIINTGSTITGMSIGALNSSNFKFIVSTQSYKHFKNFEKLFEQIFVNLDIGLGDFYLILNKYIEASNLVDEVSLSKNYGIKLASVIPLVDYTVALEAENNGKTLVSCQSPIVG